MSFKEINPIQDPNQEEVINLHSVFMKYYPHWRWIAASVAVSLILGFLYAKTRDNVYQFSASVLVSSDKNKGNVGAMSMLQDLGLKTGATIVDNEEKVIHSSLLAKEVVNRLEIHTTYYKESLLNKKEELYTSSPFYVRLDPAALNSLEGSVGVKIIPSEDGKLLIEGSRKDEATDEVVEYSLSVNHLPAVVKLPAGNLYIQLREGMKMPDYPVDVVMQNPDDVAESLCGSIKTELGKKDDVIQLTYTSANKRKGKDVLNTLVTAYNDDAMDQINLSGKNTARFIDERLKLLTVELKSVEQDVENYKRSNKLTDIKSEAELFMERNSQYEQKRSEVETQLNLVKYVEDFVKSPANMWKPVPNLGLTDPGLVAVNAKYNELVLNRERILRNSSEENPMLKELTQQVRAARQAILTSIESGRKGLLIARADLNKQDQLMNSRISEVPRQEREFINIKRQQQIKETLYLFLLQKREDAALTMAITVPKGRMLNSPNKAVRVAPKKMLILLVFFAIGFIIPILIIYFLNLFRITIRNREDLEDLTNVPVISELGHQESDSSLVNHKSQLDANSELFRLLRAKIQFTLDYPREKVIVITSTVPGEGKTFTSMNLAISLSLSEKKVLLIGLDLRKPQLAKSLNIQSPLGITAFLSGQEGDYKKLIFPSADFPFLDVMPAGVIPANPSELIMRRHLDVLIEQARSEYEYIIIDSAPVGAVADTLLLDRLSDLNIYVCRANYTKKHNLKLLNMIHHESSLTPLYLLLNDVDQKFHTYGNYGGKYGYARHRNI